MRIINQFIKACLKPFGLHLVKLAKPGASGAAYELVTPYATYSPWNLDRDFQDVYAKIRDNTLVDAYRCYDLWMLVEQAAQLESGALIEIGVWRGGTGGIIAKRAKDCGIAERVYLCDTFEGVVKAGDEDSSYSGGEHSDTSLETARTLVEDTLGLGNVTLLQGIFPDDTGDQVQEPAFRFCHIDVDVYQSAKDIVDWIWDRMVPGGIFVYDDFGFKGCDGIAKYVGEQAAMPDRVVIQNLNGHAVVIKR